MADAFVRVTPANTPPTPQGTPSSAPSGATFGQLAANQPPGAAMAGAGSVASSPELARFREVLGQIARREGHMREIETVAATAALAQQDALERQHEELRQQNILDTWRLTNGYLDAAGVRQPADPMAHLDTIRGQAPGTAAGQPWTTAQLNEALGSLRAESQGVAGEQASQANIAAGRATPATAELTALLMAAVAGTRRMRGPNAPPPPAIHPGQQGKHIQGHNNFDPTRSELTANPQRLYEAYAGKGQPVNDVERGQPGFRERFDTGGELIGIYRNQNTGAEVPTTNGIIHYGLSGAHIVPAAPNPRGGR